jgi:3',5'-cyclic AMP phosphodiesterase CpdA
MGNGRLTICQISDIHCGNARFVPDLLDRTIIEINRADPTAVVVSGDLTDAGYREEFEQAAEYIARIECENVVVIPGNHDARNVGYVHFERLFGDRQTLMELDDVVLVAVDSSEPDLNDGQVGREHYGFIDEAFSDARDKLKVFVVHHHLVSLPGTGRERNIVFDAGDVLERLVEAKVDVVLSGHKHVPHTWKLEDMLIVNAGTASTLRLRGNTHPCYNVIEAEEGRVEVYRKYPFKQRELAVRWDRKTRDYSRSEEMIGTEASGHPRYWTDSTYG